MRAPFLHQSPSRRRTRLAVALFCLGAAMATARPTCAPAAECHGTNCQGHRCGGKGCGGQACCPHCPVRPAEFGFYGTQWRRWPTADQRPLTQPPKPLPAVPPASVVPRVDEESPRVLPPLPATDRQSDTRPVPPPAGREEPNPDRSGTAPTSDQRRSAIVAEATAVRAAPPTRQEEFARRLVDAVVAEHDPAIRSLIVETAAGLQAPSAIAICRGAVSDPDPRVRMAACTAWLRLGGGDAVAELSRRYREDDDLGVRLRALRALGELKDAAAIPVVVTALDDPDPAVQTRAVQALKQLTGRNLGNDPQAWRTWAAYPEGKPSWNIAETLRRMF